MNKENLLRMVDYIETVPQDMFDMKHYRGSGGNQIEAECDGVGCIIGHCIHLDAPENIPRDSEGQIMFTLWSINFTDVESEEWKYLFYPSWCNIDNTPIGAAKRIRWVVEHGVPDNADEQMRGEAPLSYLEA